MESISILDQIINNQKAEEVAKLDAVEIINNLFNELTDREQDVLMRRYGLHGKGKETLESIGSAHQLTRERIRQIETTSIKKLQQLKNLEDYINTLKKVIIQLLEEHGGLVEKEYMLNLLVNFSINGLRTKAEDEIIHKNYLNFLITKLLFNEFEELNNSKHFLPAYKLKYQSLDHFEEIVVELLEKVQELKDVLKTEELIKHTISLDTFGKHKDKILTENRIDISKVLKSDLFEEKHDVINKYKPIFSLLKAAKKLEQNKFGHWGLDKWRVIKPKTINDKIYLVLKNHGEPMHFVEIADKINQIEFDNKRANAATVHNELILDNKYVLIGRGIYGLKEWGLKEGTVSDVIEDILSDTVSPLSKDEIIQKVLDKRLVKKATIILALMNKDKFAKDAGKYKLANVDK
ncbi:sigma factor-like helix-turn-helix DNA-binding protein [Patescibacteria group bacterium]